MMKKSSFFTFCCAFIPGAGQMYLGMMKKGAILMFSFVATMALASFFRLDFFLFFLPVIWFYSFFDTLNIKWMTPEERQELDEQFSSKLFSGNQFYKGWFDGLKQKHSLLAGGALILIGIYLLFSNIVHPILREIFEIYGIDFWLFNYMIRTIPSLFISIAIIVLGIHLVRGKKVSPSEKDFVEFKGDNHE